MDGIIKNSSFDAIRLTSLVLGHFIFFVLCVYLGEGCGSWCSKLRTESTIIWCTLSLKLKQAKQSFVRETLL